MKKIRRTKISVTTREILVSGTAAPETSAETELSLCPACNSRIADAIGSAVAALTETDSEYELEIKEI